MTNDCGHSKWEHTTLCRLYELYVTVIGIETNADFSAANGRRVSVGIVSKRFKRLLFQGHEPMEEVLISSSILSDKRCIPKYEVS